MSYRFTRCLICFIFDCDLNIGSTRTGKTPVEKYKVFLILVERVGALRKVQESLEKGKILYCCKFLVNSAKFLPSKLFEKSIYNPDVYSKLFSICDKRVLF